MMVVKEVVICIYVFSVDAVYNFVYQFNEVYTRCNKVILFNLVQSIASDFMNSTIINMHIKKLFCEYFASINLNHPNTHNCPELSTCTFLDHLTMQVMIVHCLLTQIEKQLKLPICIRKWIRRA